MISALMFNFRSDPRCWLMVLTAALAVVLGFRAIPDGLALTIVSKAGFWFVFVTFGIWVFALWRTFALAIKSLTWRAIDWASVGVVLAGGVILLSHEKFGFKIVMDEVMLLGTSMSMHLDKTVFTPTRGHDINNVFMLFDGIIDKRPLFFPFLVSLLHDVTGYRPENAFFLNGFLTFVFLGLTCLVGNRVGGRVAGWLGVTLFAGLPLLAHNCTGGGFELLNLTMILTCLLLGAHWIERRDAPSLVAFCFGALLLAQVRYESAIFLLPVAVLVLFGWWTNGRALLPWPILSAPLLMILLPLHHRVFQVREAAWEMSSKPGYTDPFSLSYLAENLQHAVVFFFASQSEQPNSVLLSAIGVVAVPFCAILLLRRIRAKKNEPAISLSLTAFAVGLLLHFILLMCYFWGKFDDPVIRRLSLPTHLGLVLAVLMVLPQFKKPSVMRVTMLVALLSLFGRGIPSMAAHAYSQIYLPGREVAWRREFMKKQPRRDYFMIDTDSILWVTHRVSATPTPVAIARRKDLAFHMRNRAFSDFFVFQRFEIDPTTSERKLREGDDLGDAFVLEPVVEARLHIHTLSRISRVTQIKDEDDPISSAVPIGERSTMNRAELDRARRVYHENYMKKLP